MHKSIFVIYSSCVIVKSSREERAADDRTRADFTTARVRAESFLPARVRQCARRLLLTLSDRHARISLRSAPGLWQWHNRLNSGSRYRSREKASRNARRKAAHRLPRKPPIDGNRSSMRARARAYRVPPPASWMQDLAPRLFPSPSFWEPRRMNVALEPCERRSVKLFPVPRPRARARAQWTTASRPHACVRTMHVHLSSAREGNNGKCRSSLTMGNEIGSP